MAAFTASCPVSVAPRRSVRPVRRAVDTQATAAKTKSVRLTRRGRLVLSLATVGLAAALLVGFVAFLVGPGAAAAAASGAVTQRPAAVTFVVQPGQTLWTIALKVAPGVDPRETITMLQEANNLTNSSVFAGQRLIIPTQN